MGIVYYKNINDYAEKENVHRNTASVHMKKMIKEGVIEPIPEDAKFIRVV